MLAKHVSFKESEDKDGDEISHGDQVVEDLFVQGPDFDNVSHEDEI
jgi:hypothetical protein